jgi:hypothetical protein
VTGINNAHGSTVGEGKRRTAGDQNTVRHRRESRTKSLKLLKRYASRFVYANSLKPSRKLLSYIRTTMTELIWDGKYKDSKKVRRCRCAPFRPLKRWTKVCKTGRGAWSCLWPWRRVAQPWLGRQSCSNLLPVAGKVNLTTARLHYRRNFSYTATIPDNPTTNEDETASFIKEPSILNKKHIVIHGAEALILMCNGFIDSCTTTWVVGGNRTIYISAWVACGTLCKNCNGWSVWIRKLLII